MARRRIQGQAIKLAIKKGNLALFIANMTFQNDSTKIQRQPRLSVAT